MRTAVAKVSGTGMKEALLSREAPSGLRPSNRSDQLGLGELAVADQHLHGLEPAFPLTAAREHAAR